MPFDGPLPQSSQTDLEILKQVRNLLRDRISWCVREYSTIRRVEPVDPTYAHLIGGHCIEAYCLIGALAKAAGNRNVLGPTPVEERVIRVLYGALPLGHRIRHRMLFPLQTITTMRSAVIKYNDGSSRMHQDILTVLDKAIARMSGTVEANA